jgi:hypothetical protein
VKSVSEEGERGRARRHDDQDREPPSVRHGHEHEGVGGDAVLDRLLHEQEGEPGHGQPDRGLVEGTTGPQARQPEVTVEEPEENESDQPGDRRQRQPGDCRLVPAQVAVNLVGGENGLVERDVPGQRADGGGQDPPEHADES